MIGPLRLSKMSGAGNDFLVLTEEAFEAVGGNRDEWIRTICRRRTSVGADGLLVVGARGADRVHVTFFNPDASRAFCGNGSRCAARFAAMRGLAAERMVLDTAVGDVPAAIRADQVELTLPAPSDDGRRTLTLQTDPESPPLDGRFVHAGVPHFVSTVDGIEQVSLARLGPAVRRHPELGAAGSNLDLVEDLPDGSIAIRTWERGVEGETLACGSGAVAAAFDRFLSSGRRELRVVPASRIPLRVTFTGDAGGPGATLLAGDARWIFDAEVHAEATGP